MVPNGGLSTKSVLSDRWIVYTKRSITGNVKKNYQTKNPIPVKENVNKEIEIKIKIKIKIATELKQSQVIHYLEIIFYGLAGFMKIVGRKSANSI